MCCPRAYSHCPGKLVMLLYYTNLSVFCKIRIKSLEISNWCSVISRQDAIGASPLPFGPSPFQRKRVKEEVRRIKCYSGARFEIGKRALNTDY